MQPVGLPGSSSCCTLVSAAEGIVVKNLTVRRPGEPGVSESSWMTALCLMRRGFDRDLALLFSAGTDTTVVRMSLEALERDILHVLVLAVVAEPEESFLELDRFES